MESAELIIRKGPQALLHLRLTQAETYIGRMATNDVVLPDEGMPELAAVLIDRGANRYFLRDASDGFLRVDGEVPAHDEVELADGARIELGPYQLRLEVRPEPDLPRAGPTALLSPTTTAHAQAVLRSGEVAYTVDGDRPFNIGGHDDNDLVLSDPFVSSFHCRISQRHDQWYIADLGSTNGTRVNGLKISEAELPVPAQIEVGKVNLAFEAMPEGSADGGVSRFHGMIAASPAMHRVFALVDRFADAKEPVLIFGESGSGKELVARALHESSSRRNAPYLALNCSALNSQLIESELFGHLRGAFTGALSDKAGAFEATSEGTLFLDEIGELPLELQPKLLRVLETSTVRRVGGTKEIPVDTRVVAATHRNLEQMVQEGMFREDLFHRLFVLSVSIPPLRNRPEDVLALADHFLRGQAPRTMQLGDDAKKALELYEWPGNVRELRNVLVRAILMTDGDVIRAPDLQFSRDAFSRGGRDARRTLRNRDEHERDRIIETLEAANGNKTEAARILRMSKSTFYDRLRRYGIAPKESE